MLYTSPCLIFELTTSVVFFLYRFVRIVQSASKPFVISKHRFNRSNIETINKKKERFLAFISLFLISIFGGIRIVPRLSEIVLIK